MEKIKLELGKYLTSKSKGNWRSEVIQEFVDHLNTERVGTTYRPVTWKQINGKLAHLKNRTDLYYFLSYCKQAKNFTKAFWGSLKVK